MRESLVFATLNEVIIIFEKKSKESINFRTSLKNEKKVIKSLPAFHTFSSNPVVAHMVERRSKLFAFQHFGTHFLYSTVMNCYATVTNLIRQLSDLCNSYESYLTVIKSMRQLSALSDSYDLCSTVIHSFHQLSALCDSYQLYATVINTMRQLLALSASYYLYATVIGSMRQLLAL